MTKLTEELRKMIKNSYSLKDIENMESFLIKHHTFDFPTLPTGLYSAAALDGINEYTGYQNVWVRDNIHIANARFDCGFEHEAVLCLKSLMKHFTKELPRFKAIIDGKADPENPMKRPHIRFNGETLSELPEKWSHAQNDALGYLLWLYCKAGKTGSLKPTEEELDVLAHLVIYWKKIKYWQDKDSGHWEEARKVEASSIGTAIAGLMMLRDYLEDREIGEIVSEVGVIDLELIDDLITKGKKALFDILPFESRELESERKYDSALLFLIFPLSVINEPMADKILKQTKEHLQGEIGIKRYLGDSFWSADYKEKMSEELRTSDVSDDMSERDSLLEKGEEAQWCIFDSTVSVIYGKNFQNTKEKADIEKQIQYFNRALKQIVEIDVKPGKLLCPELFYLEKGKLVPNDVVPLLWSAANLAQAFREMKRHRI